MRSRSTEIDYLKDRIVTSTALALAAADVSARASHVSIGACYEKRLAKLLRSAPEAEQDGLQAGSVTASTPPAQARRASGPSRRVSGGAPAQDGTYTLESLAVSAGLDKINR